MRGKAMLSVCAVLLIWTSPARGEGVSFGLQGGLSIPTGDFGDSYGSGLQGGACADYWAHERFAVGLDLNAGFHSADGALEDLLRANGIAGDALKFSITRFAAHGRWRPLPGSPRAAPWLLLGLGVYNGRSTLEVRGLSVSESESKFGFDLGAGIDFAVGETTTLGLSADLHSVADALAEFDPNSGQLTGSSKPAQYIALGVTLAFWPAGAR